jgi:hypothetical protein
VPRNHDIFERIFFQRDYRHADVVIALVDRFVDLSSILTLAAWLIPGGALILQIGVVSLLSMSRLAACAFYLERERSYLQVWTFWIVSLFPDAKARSDHVQSNVPRSRRHCFRRLSCDGLSEDN